MLKRRTKAERSIDETAARLRELKRQDPRPAREIERLERRLSAAWRAVNRMRARGG